jgi:hypothetical protein
VTVNILYYKSESYIKFKILKGIGITFSFYIKRSIIFYIRYLFIK